MGVTEGLSVRMVDVACAPKCGKTPLLGTVNGTPAHSDFLRATGPWQDSRRLHSGRTVAVCSIPVARNCSTIRTHPHPALCWSKAVLGRVLSLVLSGHCSVLMVHPATRLTVCPVESI